ncbi:unnamed protein product [Tilletia controversa]|nr:unnamed protein product [Tilletia controversa]
MALKHSSSFASLKARFRSKSSAGGPKDGDDRDDNLAPADASYSSAKSLPSSPSSGLMRRPSLFRSKNSSSSGGGGGSPGSVTSSSSAGADATGSRLSRWADAPPLPIRSPSKKKPESFPLGYVPPAPLQASSTGSQAISTSPFQTPTSKAGMTAAEQGARLRQRDSRQSASASEPLRSGRPMSSPVQTPQKPQQQQQLSKSQLLPGQQQTPPPNITLSRAPPSSASQAIAASQQQQRQQISRSLSYKGPPPAASSDSANTPARTTLKRVVSITPGKESWAQAQAREQREREESKEYRYRPPPSVSSYHGHASKEPPAEPVYAGYGSGSIHTGPVPARSLSQSTRASHTGGATSAPSSPSPRRAVASESLHQTAQLTRTGSNSQFQRASIASKALAAERSRSIHAPGQTVHAPVQPAQMRPADSTAAQPQSKPQLPRSVSMGSPSHLPNGVVQALSSPVSLPSSSPNASPGPSMSTIFNAPAPPFPRAPVAQLYASCYCEENAYRLAQSLLCRPPFGMDRSRDPATANANAGVIDPKERERESMYRHMGLRWAVHVVFASNEGQNVALFAQRAGAEAGRGDGLVIWDYHVFVAVTAFLPTGNANTASVPAFAAATQNSYQPASRSLLIDSDELAGSSNAYVSKTWIYDYDSSLAYPPEYTVPGATAANSSTVRNGDGPDGLPPPTPVPFDMYALATLRLNLFANAGGASEDAKAATSGPKLPDRLRPKFRIVPAQKFLDHFASDRRHMRAKRSGDAMQAPAQARRGTIPASPANGVASASIGNSGEGAEDGPTKAEDLWTKPPPPWEAIMGKSARVRQERNNLFERYVSMAGAASRDTNSVYGVVVDAEEFVKGRWTGAVPAVPGNVRHSQSPSPSGMAPSQPVRMPSNASQASRSSSQPLGPGHAGRPTSASPPSSYRGPPRIAQQSPYSYQGSSNGLSHPHVQTQPLVSPVHTAVRQAPQGQYVQSPASMTSPLPTSRLPDQASGSGQRTWSGGAPPAVPNGPGYAPDPRDSAYRQSMPNGTPNTHGYALPSAHHQQQHQQQQQQHAGSGGAQGSGAAGVGANGTARRGGRVESPYFAAFLQASAEARAQTLPSPSQTPSSSTPSSPQGLQRNPSSYGSQSPPYANGPMPMTMGAGSMSLLMSTTAAAAAHHAAASPPSSAGARAGMGVNSRPGGPPGVGYSAAFMRGQATA